KFIDLTLYSTIGREYMLMFPTRDDDTQTLILSAFKFLCWINSEDHDRMELWYFLEAKERFTAQLEASSLIDPLNYYYLYNQHNKSFYLGDEARPDGIFLIDGILDIILKATRNEDKILVFQTDND